MASKASETSAEVEDYSQCQTPPQVARKWRVKADKVVGFIDSGELRAFNVAADTSKRPLWRIPPDAIIEFEQRRAGGPKTATKPRRGRRRKKQAVKRHFD